MSNSAAPAIYDRTRCKKLHYADDIRRSYAVYTDFSAGNGVKSYKPIEF